MHSCEALPRTIFLFSILHLANLVNPVQNNLISPPYRSTPYSFIFRHSVTRLIPNCRAVSTRICRPAYRPLSDFQHFDKLLHRHSGFGNKTAKRSPRDFWMIGYGKRGNMAGFCHNDMTSLLPGYVPTELFEIFDNFGRAEKRNRRHYTVTST